MVKHIIKKKKNHAWAIKKPTILQVMGLLHVLARHFRFLTELVSVKH